MPENRGSIITFFSTKGGVGKTTILANAAIALARLGKRVAILDCDLQFGDMAIMFKLCPERTIVNLVEEPSVAMNAAIREKLGEQSAPSEHSEQRQEVPTEIPTVLDVDEHERVELRWTPDILKGYLCRHEESGVDLLLSPSRPEYAEIVQVEHVEEALRLLCELYDYVLVDTTPMFRNIELAILDVSDRIIVPVTVNLSAIKDVKLCLDLLNNLNYTNDKIALVVNRSRNVPVGGLSIQDIRDGLMITDPSDAAIEAARHVITAPDLTDDEALAIIKNARAGARPRPRDILAEVPLEEDALVTAENRGRPYMLDPANSITALGQAYVKIAKYIASPTSTQQPAHTPHTNPGVLESLIGWLRSKMPA